jgi:hypothetical protein
VTVNLWVNEEHALAYLRERDTLRPGCLFLNAEHVASDDPSNQLVGVEQHLTWLNDVDSRIVSAFGSGASLPWSPRRGPRSHSSRHEREQSPDFEP